MNRSVEDNGKLLSLAQKALSEAMESGAQWCDVSISRSSDIAVDVENGSIKSVDVIAISGLTVRAIVDGAQGVFSATGFDEADLLEGARQAVAMARTAQPDPDFRELPGPDAVDGIEGLFDERIRSMAPSDAVDMAVANVAEAREVDPSVIISGGVSLDSSDVAFANSAGIALEKQGTSIEVGFFCIVKRGDDAGSFYDFDMARVLDDLQPVGCAKAAAEQATRFLGAQKADTKKMSVVLGPLAAYSFLRSIAGSTNAESIQRQRSFMVGRRGTKVASDVLTMRDDGFIPRGMFSGRHDGEGATRKQVSLITSGVFESFLHNSYTAGKAGEENTGHGGRVGGISPTNIVIDLGERTAAEIIADTEEGVYINIGSLAPDPASGDISASVDFGFKIEKGKLVHPLVNTMVSGDIFEFLGNIDAISSDYREEPGNKLPTIRIRDVQVAGSG